MPIWKRSGTGSGGLDAVCGQSTKGKEVVSLEDKYSQDFEILWSVYPRFPVGRSVKKLAFDKFKLAKKACSFTPGDIEVIKLDILDRIKTCRTWQKDDRFGAPSMQKYFFQRLWNEPYLKIGKTKVRANSHVETEEDMKRKWALEEHKHGREVPVSYRHYLNGS